MDEEDLDALIDDENEMETYIDEDEEDMAFLAEQDEEGEEAGAAGTQNPPGTQDLDWLENEGNDDGATQNQIENVRLLRKKILKLPLSTRMMMKARSRGRKSD